MKKLKDLSEPDRPREKLQAKGPEALSDLELMAILLGSGIKESDVLTVAGRMGLLWFSGKGLDIVALFTDFVDRSITLRGQNDLPHRSTQLSIPSRCGRLDWQL
jgi:hypothetical protein